MLNDFENKYQQLLSDTEKFLKQEFEFYGNDLYKEEQMRTKKVTEPTSTTRSEELFQEKWQNSNSLGELNSQICTCLKCPLGNSRTKFVFGVGNPNADLMFIGEAPGADEDLQGEPFVGRAGQLFNKILEAIQLKREDIYICNILKCRPPNNRDPQISEVEQCIPYLWKQIELVKPKIIMSLGRIAAQMLLNTNESLTKMRETKLEYRGVPLLVTFHPAALLRNPNWKRPAWEDFKKLKSMLEQITSH